MRGQREWQKVNERMRKRKKSSKKRANSVLDGTATITATALFSGVAGSLSICPKDSQLKWTQQNKKNKAAGGRGKQMIHSGGGEKTTTRKDNFKKVISFTNERPSVLVV